MSHPRIVKESSVCSGRPILVGTRTTVHDIVNYCHVYGGDVRRVVEAALPHLTIEDVQAALDYYEDNAEEIDAILARRQADYERILAKRNET